MTLFLLSVVCIWYVYFGYPILLWLTGKVYKRPVRKKNIYPSLSMVISAHNEARSIEAKIRNCLALDYPAGKLEVLVGSDGSTDATRDILDRYNERGIKAFYVTPNNGKASMLNLLVSKAKGELIVFADARQRFHKKALLELAANFADEGIGCVTGELVLESHKKTLFSKGLRAYWDYETFLRRLESRVYSVTGATGAIYAIRRKLFVPIEENIILDDVYVPLKIIEQGYRAVVEPRAIAYDEASADRHDESRRKRRTLAGNWQIFLSLAGMLNPFRSPVAVQLFSHKVLRVLLPYFIILAFVSNLFLLKSPLFMAVFLLQSAFYIAAALGPFAARLRVGLLALPYAFCMLNIDAIAGTYAYFAGTQKVTWSQQ